MSTVSYLDRFLEPVTEAFTPRLARLLVDLRADDKLQAEIEVLRQKSNEGTLSPDEQREYETWVRAGTFISVLQAKARLATASRTEASAASFVPPAPRAA